MNSTRDLQDSPGASASLSAAPLNPSAGSPGPQTSDPLVHTHAGRWNAFELPCRPPSYCVATELGLPGLWKTVWRDSGLRRVFEFPDWSLPSLDEQDEWFEPGSGLPLAIFSNWAREVAHGRMPAGWRPPGADVAQAWMPEGALTVHARGLLRQGRMILTAERWALHMPLVEHVSNDLPQLRRRVLEDLLLDAQSRWAMPRVGFNAQPGEAAIMAEVDLTGAPHRESLLLAALEALRSVTAWVVEPAELLADVRVEISALALCFNKARERTTR